MHLQSISLDAPTLLSSVFIRWDCIKVATEATGAIGVEFSHSHGDVGRIINGDSEAKLFAPEFIKPKL